MVVKSATKKQFLDFGFPEGMAHYLADDITWNRWRELPMKGRNSGFKKQFYKRMRSFMKGAEKSTNITPPHSPNFYHQAQIAYDNEYVSEIAHNMINSLPVLSPDDRFSTATSQGLFNWVSFEGTKLERQHRLDYEQAIGIFDLPKYQKNLEKAVKKWHGWGEEKRGKNPYYPEGFDSKYDEWIREYQQPKTNPYDPSHYSGAAA